MVDCNTLNPHLRLYTPLSSSSSLLVITAVCVLIGIIPRSTAKLSFNLANISTYHNNVLRAYGDANITGKGIQLTATEDKMGNTTWQAGRVIYYETLHLWDNASGMLADFKTHFSFVIDSGKDEKFADGLAFFLTPYARIDSSIVQGSAMGLPVKTSSTHVNPFVAVEFDTFNNLEYDFDNITTTTHVGIDVNSLKSLASREWYSDVPGGVENEAWISYDPGLKILNVLFTDNKYVGNTRVKSGFNCSVDLREYLPEWVAIGFSAATGGLDEKHYVKSWQFNSSLVNLAAGTPRNNDGSAGKNGGGESSTKKKALLVGFVTGGSFVLLGGLALVGFLLWRKSRGKDAIDRVSMDNEFETAPKKFPYKELSHATNNFSEELKLGEGGFGGVYKGFLGQLNSYVAVKRISKSSKQGIMEYASEVKIISRLRHRNLVLLYGWCHEKRQLLLVYEYLAMGSLDFHLFKETSLLTWPTRFKIAQGLASALFYLHEECDQCVVHRDIKSSNVMLDSNFNAKLGDFGLARLVDHEEGSKPTVLAGTKGYMAPEYLKTSRANKESDVYSFGIVALEIACGRKAIDLTLQENQTVVLVEWVWDLYGTGKLLEAVDPKIGTDYHQEEVKCLIIVGLWCAHPDHNHRPSIRQAIHVLNSVAPLPILPEKMPAVPSFSAAPSFTNNGAAFSENSLVLRSPR